MRKPPSPRQQQDYWRELEKWNTTIVRYDEQFL